MLSRSGWASCPSDGKKELVLPCKSQWLCDRDGEWNVVGISDNAGKKQEEGRKGASRLVRVPSVPALQWSSSVLVAA